MTLAVLPGTDEAGQALAPRAAQAVVVVLGAGFEREAPGGVVVQVGRRALEFELRLEGLDDARQARRLQHAIGAEALAVPLRDRGALRGGFTDAVHEQRAVPQIDLAAPVRVRGDAQQLRELAPAPVGDGDALLQRPGAQVGDQLDDGGRQRHGGRSLAQRIELGVIEAAGIRHRDRDVIRQRQQFREASGTDRLHVAAQQEAVMEGRNRLVLGHLVAGGEHGHQRRAQAPAAVVKLAFVQQRQQRVQDRTVGLEHLVDERDRGLGQEAGGLALVAVLFERDDRQRPEQFLGHREARQQTLEVARIAQRMPQPAREFALGGAGRPEQQQVLAGERRQQRQPDLGVALDQMGRQGIEQPAQPFVQLTAHASDLRKRNPCSLLPPALQ